MCMVEILSYLPLHLLCKVSLLNKRAYSTHVPLAYPQEEVILWKQKTAYILFPRDRAYQMTANQRVNEDHKEENYYLSGGWDRLPDFKKTNFSD